MQTFITYKSLQKTARTLDNRRLGKQRIEAIQILNILMGVNEGKGWINHPAVRMWRGYEHYLLNEYLACMMIAWGDRGFKNDACGKHFSRLIAIAQRRRPIAFSVKPEWITDEFILSHRSNLIRKNPAHYGPLFPGTPKNLEYVWPVPLLTKER